MNIVGYYRVSTEEQKKYGISVDAQIAEVRKWAADNGHLLVGEYNDAGISARKPITKRKELQRLLADLEHIKVDMIVFTRLDRWFRSVKEYYKVQDVLDKYGVMWKALDEDYSTTDSVSRFKVNLMLSVAEMEADKTADRIKSVFDFKIANGEWVAPQGLCVGYSIKDKRLVPNDDAEAVRAAFEYYADNHSVVTTMDFLREQYGLVILRQSVRKILRNRLYLGEYRGNPNFCQPIVPQELFDKVQSEIAERAVRRNPSGRVYLFSGLCRCAVCGWTMTGMYSNKSGKTYNNYRCNNHAINHQCTNRAILSELKIEAHLLDRVAPELNKLIERTAVEVKPQKQPRRQLSAADIQPKLDRLKDLYVDGLIDKAQYLADRTKLLDMISQPDNEPTQPDYAALRELLGKDFRTRYGLLTAPEQRALWRTLIDHIVIDENRNISFFFKA